MSKTLSFKPRDPRHLVYLDHHYDRDSAAANNHRLAVEYQGDHVNVNEPPIVAVALIGLGVCAEMQVIVDARRQARDRGIAT